MSATQLVARAWARTPVVLAVAFALGFAFHSVKGVDDPQTLWVGNVSWPYLLVPALACLRSEGLGRMVTRAVGASLAMVLGFYNVLGLLTVSALEAGVDPATARPAVLASVVRSYLEHLVLGRPGGIPWLTVAVGTGVIVALVYAAAVARGSGAERLFWLAVAAVAFVEPAYHFVPALSRFPFAGYRFDLAGQAITLTECLLGAAVLAVAWRSTRNDTDGARVTRAPVPPSRS